MKLLNRAFKIAAILVMIYAFAQQKQTYFGELQKSSPSPVAVQETPAATSAEKVRPVKKPVAIKPQHHKTTHKKKLAADKS